MEENEVDFKAERVKLVKNTKGYNWEVSLNGSGENGILLLDDLTRLEKLNEVLRGKYGQED